MALKNSTTNQNHADAADNFTGKRIRSTRPGTGSGCIPPMVKVITSPKTNVLKMNLFLNTRVRVSSGDSVPEK
jgi:hypothetical protein